MAATPRMQRRAHARLNGPRRCVEGLRIRRAGSPAGKELHLNRRHPGPIKGIEQHRDGRNGEQCRGQWTVKHSDPEDRLRKLLGLPWHEPCELVHQETGDQDRHARRDLLGKMKQTKEGDFAAFFRDQLVFIQHIGDHGRRNDPEDAGEKACDPVANEQGRQVAGSKQVPVVQQQEGPPTTAAVPSYR